MNQSLLRKRATAAFMYCQQYLIEEDHTDYEFGEAFKYAFLLIRKPKNYLKHWKEGNLEIDSYAVDIIFKAFGDKIPGPVGLQESEQEIINIHNMMAVEWATKNTRELPQVLNLKPKQLRVEAHR